MRHLHWITVLTALVGVPVAAGPSQAMPLPPSPAAVPMRDASPWVYVSIRGARQGMLRGGINSQGHVGQLFARGFQSGSGRNGSTTFTITFTFSSILANLFAGMHPQEAFDVECDFMQSAGGSLRVSEVAHMKNARATSLKGEMSTSDPGNELVSVTFTSSDVEYTTPASTTAQDSWSTASSGAQSGGARSTSGKRYSTGHLTPLTHLPTVTATQTANAPAQVAGSIVGTVTEGFLSVEPRGTFPAPPSGRPGYQMNAFVFQADARGDPLHVPSVRVVKPVDGSTQDFHHAQSTGARLPSVVINFWGQTQTGNLVAVLRVTLRNARVRRDDINGRAEQLVFAPQSVRIENLFAHSK